MRPMDGDRAKRVLWMAGLVVLGFLLRTTNAAEVFVGKGVLFPGNDPYYQAHRVFQALASHPWVPLLDPRPRNRRVSDDQGRRLATLPPPESAVRLGSEVELDLGPSDEL